MPHSLIMRAKIVLACARGEQNKTVAESFGVSVMMVGKWRRRYLEKGIAGLQDEFRPGRPRTYDDEEITEVINFVLQTKPEDGSNHWSTSTVEEETGISKSGLLKNQFAGLPKLSGGQGGWQRKIAVMQRRAIRLFQADQCP
jgi:putative transposase